MKIKRICEYCGKEFEIYECELKWRSGRFCSRVCYSKGKVKKSIKKCEVCGKEFERIPYFDKKNKHHFCSTECYHVWLRFHPEIYIKNLPSPKEISGDKHPNWQGGKVVVTCSNCGRTIKRTRYQLKQQRNFFCCKKCENEWQSRYIRGKNNPMYGMTEEKNPFFGRHHTEKTKRIMSEKARKRAKRGKDSPFWKGGYEPYYGPNWREQRRKSLERDNNTCQICGEIYKSRNLDVHHIIPFSAIGREKYEELNNLNNLITLCKRCHGKVEKGKITIDRLPQTQYIEGRSLNTSLTSLNRSQ